MPSPTLLTLPREIRDQIIKALLQSPTPPPPSPSSCPHHIRLHGPNEPNAASLDFNSARSLPIYISPYSPILTYPEASLLLTNRQLRAETQQLRLKVERGTPVLDVMFVRHLGLLPTWVTPPNPGRNYERAYINVRVFEDAGKGAPVPPEFKNKDVAASQVNWATAVLFTLILLDNVPNQWLPKSQRQDSENSHTKHALPKPLYNINRAVINILDPPAESQPTKPSPSNPLLFADETFSRHADPVWFIPDEGDLPVPAAASTYRIAIDIGCALDLMVTESNPAICSTTTRSNIRVFENRLNGKSYGGFVVPR